MLFEFDETKSQANFTTHGITFIGAQRLWHDPQLLEIPANTADEPRYFVIGLINRQHWSAITTYSGNHIRLISVRRSRQEEVALYES